jgi:hypothetical protein
MGMELNNRIERTMHTYQHFLKAHIEIFQPLQFVNNLYNYTN